MRLTVHAIAGKHPGWVQAGTEDYQRRLPRDLDLKWCDLPMPARRGRTAAALRAEEARSLLRSIGDGDHLVALDPQGEPWTTERLARELARWLMGRQPVSFAIGGPDGLPGEVLERAAQRWSLGPLTLPHPLVRVVLTEQLYRAWTIHARHPYHRG